jgi:hypothetical protein
MTPPTAEVPALVSRLYMIVDELESLFPGRKFTPDGHLVGSIGEVMAANLYNLKLLPASAQNHDAVSSSGVYVQIKASQGSMVALREEPQHLLVLHLNRQGGVTEVYNGPGSLAWNACGSIQRNGQRPISFARLKSLMGNIQEAEKLPVHPCA